MVFSFREQNEASSPPPCPPSLPQEKPTKTPWLPTEWTLWALQLITIWNRLKCFKDTLTFFFTIFFPAVFFFSCIVYRRLDLKDKTSQFVLSVSVRFWDTSPGIKSKQVLRNASVTKPNVFIFWFQLSLSTNVWLFSFSSHTAQPEKEPFIEQHCFCWGSDAVWICPPWAEAEALLRAAAARYLSVLRMHCLVAVGRLEPR